MSDLYHKGIIEEYGERVTNKKGTLFKAAGIELINRGSKKYIKIDTTKFGQYFPSEFRKILENPSIRDIDELKNRTEDFLRPNTKSNSLEGLPVRVAFSTFPLTYNGFSQNILSLIESGNISFNDILDNSDDFNLDLTINNNPEGFFGGLAPINAKIIDNPVNSTNILLNERINQILGNINYSTVSQDTDMGLIISDGINEQIIDGYSYTFDKQVAGVEMGKTTVRKPSDLILEDLDDWKKERFNLNVSLSTLIDYFNNYYTSSNNDGNSIEAIMPSLKLFNQNDKIKLGNLFLGKTTIVNDYKFKEEVERYKKDNRKRYREYVKFLKKLTFLDSGIIEMSIKDLKLTPPVALWLEKLLKEGNAANYNKNIYGNTLTEKNKEIEKTSIAFENMMFDILGQKGESKLLYLQKNKKGKFGKQKIKTPDYIEKIDNKSIIIYDFKIAQTKTNYDNFVEKNKFKFFYKKQDVTVSEVKIISLDKKIGGNNNNCIYFRDFIEQKNIHLSNEQEIKFKTIEANYIFSKQQFNTNNKAQKILQ